MQRQNTEKNTKNPNLCHGLWVEHRTRPELGAGQVQFFVPHYNAWFVEHWQAESLRSPGVPGELASPSIGQLYPEADLQLAQYLYMGHSNNVLCYVHGLQVRKVAFSPTPQIATAADFDEAKTTQAIQKAYLVAAHHYSQLIDADDLDYIVDRWVSTGGRAFRHLMPYLFGQVSASVTEAVAA